MTDQPTPPDAAPSTPQELRDRLIARRAAVQAQLEIAERVARIIALDRNEFLAMLRTMVRDLTDCISALASSASAAPQEQRMKATVHEYIAEAAKLSGCSWKCHARHCADGGGFEHRCSHCQMIAQALANAANRGAHAVSQDEPSEPIVVPLDDPRVPESLVPIPTERCGCLSPKPPGGRSWVCAKLDGHDGPCSTSEDGSGTHVDWPAPSPYIRERANAAAVPGETTAPTQFEPFQRMPTRSEKHIIELEAALDTVTRESEHWHSHYDAAQLNWNECLAQLADLRARLQTLKAWVKDSDCCYGGSCVAGEIEQRLAVLLTREEKQ